MFPPTKTESIRCSEKNTHNTARSGEKKKIKTSQQRRRRRNSHTLGPGMFSCRVLYIAKWILQTVDDVHAAVILFQASALPCLLYPIYFKMSMMNSQRFKMITLDPLLSSEGALWFGHVNQRIYFVCCYLRSHNNQIFDGWHLALVGGMCGCAFKNSPASLNPTSRSHVWHSRPRFLTCFFFFTCVVLGSAFRLLSWKEWKGFIICLLFITFYSYKRHRCAFSHSTRCKPSTVFGDWHPFLNAHNKSRRNSCFF